MTVELTTTQKLWKPISELQAEAEQIGVKLRRAALKNDIDTMMALGRRLQEINDEMRDAGQNAREYARSKAQAREAKLQPDKSNYPAIGQMLLHAWEWGIKTGRIRIPPGVSVETDQPDEPR